MITILIKGFRFTFGRDTDDCEKLVLPAIVFININHPSFEENRAKGFLVCVGWWDFSVKIGILF